MAVSEEESSTDGPIGPPSDNHRLQGMVALVLIVVVTIFHYITDPHAVEFHNVYRRLYYIPIVLAAFAYGLRGGIGAAVLASLAYMPHAFFMAHRDPSPALDKALEMILYVGIGGLTGWLVGRQKEILRALERSLEERDALEESLVRAGKLSALGQLTSGLAHEIRNPLASIMGSAESLAEEFDEEHRKHRLAQVMLKEIDRLNSVVDDFLAFARPGEPEDGEADLAKVVEEVGELTEPQARSEEVEVSVDLEADRWLVRADAGQVSQVVLNLFLNAYQAFGRTDFEADHRPRVEVAAEERTVGGRDFACLIIRDNAGGIPAELRDRIFDPYFTTRDEGTGLGLSVSSRIVEAHEGFIDLEVDKEAGTTTFYVCWPATSS
jgi:signal transduction histidine kinase